MLKQCNFKFSFGISQKSEGWLHLSEADSSDDKTHKYNL